MTQKDQPNVPKLRFREFAGAWEGTRIGDIGTFFYGKSAPKFSLVESGGTPCVRYGELYSLYDAVISEVVSQTSVPRKNLRFSKGGEILVPRVGEDPMDFAANSSFLPLKDIAIGEMISAFRTKEDPVFFTHYFRTRKKQFARVVEGGNVSNLYYSYLESIEIGRPTLHEQRKIASFLGAVDTKIAQFTEKKRLLREYKKGCMQQLFSQKTRFKDDKGKDFPDWKETRLGEVFSWINTNSLSRDRLTYDGGQVQNIHYGDIHTKFAANFYQDAEPVPYVKDATPADFKPEQFCKVGDVVIADASEDYADIGKAIEIVSLGDTPMVAGLHTYIARPKPATVQIGFAGYLLRSAPMRRQIERIAQGISVVGISKGNLEKLTLFLPHPDEQRKIADFLSALDRKIDLVGQELEHAKTFKKGLLQQMFV